ncbi:hypothetical protein BH09PSE2_BH09PSE2_08590 [soil metagenome]
MPHTLASLIGLTVMLCACGIGLLGGERERIAAIALGGAILASIGVQQLSDRWAPVTALAVIDLGLLVVFAGVSWKAPRRWPVAAVALQGVIVGLDTLKLTNTHIEAYTYLTLVAVVSYGLAGVVGWAGWSSWRRRRRLPS